MKNCYVLVCETTDNQEVFVFWYLNDARMNAKALANEVIDLYKAQGGSKCGATKRPMGWVGA